MKTPRDLLLEKHRSAEPRLDAVRETALAGLVPPRRNAPPAENPWSLRDWLLSLRWHLTALAAAWLVVAFLNLDLAGSTGQPEVIAREQNPPAQIILMTLRENRRQLLEMVGSVEAREAAPPKALPPRPRSEQRYESPTA